MKRAIISILSALALILITPAIVSADVVCQPIYGGGVSCPPSLNIAIDKKVLHPATNTFVDNLSVNDPKFAPQQIVTFELTVKNTGNTNLSKVDVKDVFPQFVEFVSGPGTFDAGSKTLIFSVHDLVAGEARTFTITAKVVKSDQLPSQQGVTCVVNQAIAVTHENKSAQDNAQFCIEKKVLGAVPSVTKGGLKVFPPKQVPVTPPTGPEMLPLIGLIPSGLLGIFLRKKAQ